MRGRVAELAEQQQLVVPGAVAHGADGFRVRIHAHRAAPVALRMVYLVALGDGDDALVGEPAGDGRAADGAEAGLAEGAAGLDAAPGHDADEAEVVGAAVELAADGLPAVDVADAAHLPRALRLRLVVHLGLALGRRRRREGPGVAAGGRGHV